MILMIFIPFFLLTSCANQKEKPPVTEISPIIYETEPLPEPSIEDIPSFSEEEVQAMISNVLDFNLKDNVTLDSPKRFLQISILFTLSQNSNYYNISQKKNKNEEEISTFMNKKREKFYRTLGIAENEYIDYGITHSKEIQDFLLTNKEFSYIYEIIQSQVTD